MKMSTVLLTGAASAVFAFTTVATYAQSTEAAPAGVQDAEGQGFSDIVVTARKRAESAQDTPVSLTVAGEMDLANRSVKSLLDIQTATPSLRFAPSAISPSALYLSARGLIVQDTRLTVDPAIGVYIDGVNIPRTYGLAISEMFDASRVEVLKGPQGTLYGKNNTGGAVNIYYNEPTDDLGGKLKFRFAEGKELDGALALNIPLAEGAGLRLVGQSNYRDGYGKNITTGTDFGKLKSHNFRGTLALQPTERLRVVLRGDYLKAYTTSNAFKSGDTLQDGTALTEVLRALGINPATATAAQRQAARDAYTSYSDVNSQDGANDVDSFERIRTWGYSATVSYDLTDDLQLKSISALRQVRSSGATDLDGSPFSLLSYPEHIVRDKSFSQEVQLAGKLFDNRVDFIVGGYYSDEDGYERTRQVSFGLLTGGLAGATINEGNIENQTYAVFGQTTVRLLDTLSVTGGLRYTKDKRSLESFNRNPTSCLALGTPIAALVGPCTTGPLKADFNAFSYTGSIEYRPTADLMLYARVDRGYRTGGLPFTGGLRVVSGPPRVDAARASYVEVAPEFAQSYEAGVKSELFDRRVRANVSVYSVKYTDLQKNASRSDGGTPPAIINYLANAASARVKGIEADIGLRLVRGLEIDGALSYIDPNYLQYVDNGVDRSDEPFIEVPKLTYSLSGAYTIPTGFGNLRFQADYAWQDRTITSTLEGIRPSNESLNARISIDIDDGRLNLAIYGRNLTDDTYGTFPLDLRSLPGRPSLGIRTTGSLNPPRTFGLEVTSEF